MSTKHSTAVSSHLDENNVAYSIETSKSILFNRFILSGLTVGTNVNLAASHELQLEGLIQFAQVKFFSGRANIQAFSEELPVFISRIHQFASESRIHKKEPALVFLALAMDSKMVSNMDIRRAASEALIDIIRTLSDLYNLAAILSILGKTTGSIYRRTLGKSVLKDGQNPSGLMYSALKYRQRYGWNLRDLLRVAHPQPKHFEAFFQHTKPEVADTITKFILMRTLSPQEDQILRDNFPFYNGYMLLNKDLNLEEVEAKVWKNIITDNKLCREMLPTELLNRRETWEALLPGIPGLALLRNLSQMTRCGLFDDKQYVDSACEKILQAAEDHSKVHPMHFILGSYAYSKGISVSGTRDFTPNKVILRCLEQATANSFASMKPTGKRVMHGIDMSASMFWESARVGGRITNPLSGEVAILMSLINARTEPYDNVDILGFGLGGIYGSRQVVNMDKDSPEYDLVKNYNLTDIKKQLNMKAGLMDNVKAFQKMMGGGTNLGAVIRYAFEKNIHVDAFVFWTDNDLNSDVPPKVILEKYRKKVNPNAKLITVALAGNARTIADPEDYNMLDLVGFDAQTPALIHDFINDVW